MNLQIDPGKHYRAIYKHKLTEQEKEQGFAEIQVDPAFIDEVYKGMSGLRFTILKKVLRCGTGNKTYRQDIEDIISAAQRELQILELFNETKTY